MLTTAGKKTASIIGRLSEDLTDTLSGVRSAGLVVVHLKVPRSARLIPDAFGVLFPAGMPDDRLGIMFNSIIFPHVAPPDYHLLTVVLGGTQSDGRVFQEEELRERLPPLLSKLLGIRDAQWLSITQWHEAIPQLVVGHHRIVEQLDLCEKVFPGIVFAGVDRGGVGVSDRIKISREAVRRFRSARVETVV